MQASELDGVYSALNNFYTSKEELFDLLYKTHFGPTLLIKDSQPYSYEWKCPLCHHTNVTRKWYCSDYRHGCQFKLPGGYEFTIDKGKINEWKSSGIMATGKIIGKVTRIQKEKLN